MNLVWKSVLVCVESMHEMYDQLVLCTKTNTVYFACTVYTKNN